jgi:hypothetical protein
MFTRGGRGGTYLCRLASVQLYKKQFITTSIYPLQLYLPSADTEAELYMYSDNLGPFLRRLSLHPVGKAIRFLWGYLYQCPHPDP